MAWYDAQIPAWIKPAVVTPTEGGNAFAQGVELGLRQQQLRLQAEQYAIMQLRESQQLEAIRQRNRIQAQKEAAEDTLRVRTEEGYAKLAGHMATVGSYQGGAGDPQFRQGFWNIVRDYPSLARDPRFHYFSEDLDNFDKIEARKEAQIQDEEFRWDLAQYTQQGRETLQEMEGRQAIELEVARQSGRVDLENVRSQHRIEQLEAEARRRSRFFLTDRVQLKAFDAKLYAATRSWKMKRASEADRREAINRVLREFNLTEAGLPTPPPEPQAAPPPSSTITEPYEPPPLPPAEGMGFDVPGAMPAAPAAPPPLSERFRQWQQKQK